MTREYGDWDEVDIVKNGHDLLPPSLEIFGLPSRLYHLRGELDRPPPRAAFDDPRLSSLLPDDLPDHGDWVWVMRHHLRTLYNREPHPCECTDLHFLSVAIY